jgi:divalent metal cation (Fe/Co/Zn/Cd) transporter
VRFGDRHLLFATAFLRALATGIKFVAFFLSGSGAMLSEAIHSAADTGNQVRWGYY